MGWQRAVGKGRKNSRCWVPESPLAHPSAGSCGVPEEQAQAIPSTCCQAEPRAPGGRTEIPAPQTLPRTQLTQHSPRPSVTRTSCHRMAGGGWLQLSLQCPTGLRRPWPCLQGWPCLGLPWAWPPGAQNKGHMWEPHPGPQLQAAHYAACFVLNYLPP